MNTTSQYRQGFFKAVIIIVVALAIAAWFGFDIGEHVDKEKIIDALKRGWDFLVSIWNEYLVLYWENYLKKPLLMIWEKVQEFI